MSIINQEFARAACEQSARLAREMGCTVDWTIYGGWVDNNNRDPSLDYPEPADMRYRETLAVRFSWPDGSRHGVRILMDSFTWGIAADVFLADAFQEARYGAEDWREDLLARKAA